MLTPQDCFDACEAEGIATMPVHAGFKPNLVCNCQQAVPDANGGIVHCSTSQITYDRSKYDRWTSMTDAQAAVVWNTGCGVYY